jgi:hypothetical protein
MKSLFLVFLLGFFCIQFSTAQQIFHTNKKSTCTYQESIDFVWCTEEINLEAIFTFDVNEKLLTQHVNGTDVLYSIESRVLESPYWKYRIANTEGVMYDLRFYQTDLSFYFFPVNPVNGNIVYSYTH